MTDTVDSEINQAVVAVMLHLASLDRQRAIRVLNNFAVHSAKDLKEDQISRYLTQALEEIEGLEYRKEMSQPKENMTLRDAFAIAALQSQVILSWSLGPFIDGDAAAGEMARRAYLIADAMIKERKK